AVIRRRNRTEFDHGHHLAVGFTENLALFEVPFIQFKRPQQQSPENRKILGAFFCGIESLARAPS
ncbi:hypothetical protein, partial [Stutzerimonas balearica]|uniref:hypothetical protein n=1 Tax=Stutzerimonas balearica TaxID=74829 RepID=UPI00384F72C3